MSVRNVITRIVPENFDRSLDTEAVGAGVNNTPATLGVANSWSVSSWFNTNQTTVHHLCSMFKVGAESELQIQITQSVPRITVQNYDSAGSAIKSWLWEPSTMSLDTWYHIVVTWDGTDLVLYLDGSEETVTTKTTDNSGTMTDTVRGLGWGYYTGAFVGLVGPLALWSTVLDVDDAAEIFNPTTGTPFERDLNVDGSGYDKASSLVHFYRPSTFQPGTVDQTGSLALDLGGATQGDVSTDTPA